MTIRILLTGLTAKVADDLQSILRLQSDMEVIGHPADPIEVLLSATRDGADVVVLGMQKEQLPGIASHLLSECPQLRILAVRPDGRAFLIELRLQAVPLGPLSVEQLVQAIRIAVRADST